MSNKNEYMRQYMATLYIKRKEQAIKLLGGCCVNCGATKQLEFDHVNSSTKSFTIGAKLNTTAWYKIEQELKKCQLLCYTCHKIKHAIKEHGTLSMYRYCRCEDCVRAKTTWQREYKRRRGVMATQIALNDLE